MLKYIFGIFPMAILFMYFQTISYLLLNICGSMTDTYFGFLSFHTSFVAIQIIIIMIIFVNQELDRAKNLNL